MLPNRVASVSAAAAFRLPIVTDRAPAARQVYTTACAAPPAPATTTAAPSSVRPIARSTPARNPAPSLLNPTSRPSASLVTLLTAPIRSASDSVMSHRPATTRLYGAVTPSPSHSSVRAAATAASTSSGSSSRSSYRASIPAAANAASCMTCECRRRSGLPSSATRRVIGARGSAGGAPGPTVGGNTTLGMISSTHSWSWAGSGVIVCRKKYSTPASTRAWSDAMISSGVPNR